MKKTISLAVALLMGCAAFAQSELPTTELKDLKTKKKVEFNNTIEKGKVTVVSFWATWCVNCKLEIRTTRKKMADWKKEVDFNYATVSIDDSKLENMAAAYAKTEGWEFPAYIDVNSEVKRSLNFEDPPFTMIVDKNGKIAYTHTGFKLGDEEELFKKIKEIAAK